MDEDDDIPVLICDDLPADAAVVFSPRLLDRIAAGVARFRREIEAERRRRQFKVMHGKDQI